MKTTTTQDVVIDALLATHRELTCVDLVIYEMYRVEKSCQCFIRQWAKGSLCLKIKSGECWYSYKILANGAITEKRKSANDISYVPLKYFTI